MSYFVASRGDAGRRKIALLHVAQERFVGYHDILDLDIPSPFLTKPTMALLRLGRRWTEKVGLVDALRCFRGRGFSWALEGVPRRA